MSNGQKVNQLGAYIGSFIGCMGWVIGFFFVALYSGTLSTFLKPLLIGALLSISIFLIVAIIMENCRLMNMIQQQRAIFMLCLWGLILFFVGNLSILITHWLAPLIDSNPQLVHTLQNMKSVYRVDDNLSILILLASSIVLGLAFMKLYKKSSC